MPSTVLPIMFKHCAFRTRTNLLFSSLPKSPSQPRTDRVNRTASPCSDSPARSISTTILLTPTLWRPNRRASSSMRCSARRRSARYGSEDDEEEEEEVYGYNEEIAMLELYSQSARGEALIVHAAVDGEEVEVLIFKGFSSSLSYGTSSDPSRSILPARAEIRSIDRVKGPFDPSNIEYIQRGLTWDNFKSNFLPN